MVFAIVSKVQDGLADARPVAEPWDTGDDVATRDTGYLPGKLHGPFKTFKERVGLAKRAERKALMLFVQLGRSEFPEPTTEGVAADQQGMVHAHMFFNLAPHRQESEGKATVTEPSGKGDGDYEGVGYPIDTLSGSSERENVRAALCALDVISGGGGPLGFDLNRVRDGVFVGHDRIFASQFEGALIDSGNVSSGAHFISFASPQLGPSSMSHLLGTTSSMALIIISSSFLASSNVSTENANSSCT